MGMYSVNVAGKVLDYKYKKQTEIIYAFYIGDILIGQLFKMRRGWSAVSWKTHSELCPVHGFRTRFDASEFLLKVNGYVKEGR